MVKEPESIQQVAISFQPTFSTEVGEFGRRYI
jgi:hypothetical protein